MVADPSYVHALEGRLRVRIPMLKGAMRRARELEARLGQLPGVEQASANPTTGSLLILYLPHLLEQADLISYLREWGYLPAVRPGPHGPGAVEKVTATVAATLVEVALSRLVGALI